MLLCAFRRGLGTDPGGRFGCQSGASRARAQPDSAGDNRNDDHPADSSKRLCQAQLGFKKRD